MSQNRANSTAFIETEQYSGLILRNLHDGLLPGTFYRNVTDFGSGTTLNIKTVGSVTIQDVAEDVAVDYTPIESGTIKMTIDNYIGDAWYVTDELKEDGAQIDALMTARSMESARSIKEVFETRYLARAVSALTPAAPNPVNGFNHMMTIFTIGRLNMQIHARGVGQRPKKFFHQRKIKAFWHHIHTSGQKNQKRSFG